MWAFLCAYVIISARHIHTIKMTKKQVPEQRITKIEHSAGATYVENTGTRGSHQRMVSSCKDMICKMDKLGTLHKTLFVGPYSGNQNKILVKCLVCESTWQAMPGHLKKGHHCPKCARKKSRKKESFDYICTALTRSMTDSDLEKISILSYDPRNNKVVFHCSSHKLIFKREYGYALSVKSRRYTNLYPKCVKENRKNEFSISTINKLKNNKSDIFDLSSAKPHPTDNKKVLLRCLTCNTIEEKIIGNVTRNQGCLNCSITNAVGFAYRKMIKYNPDRLLNKATLYMLEFYNDSERFIKVGVTTRSVGERYKNRCLGYNYNIKQLFDTNIMTAISAEKLILIENAELRIDPKVKFEGKTECFHTDLDVDLKNYIKKCISTDFYKKLHKVVDECTNHNTSHHTN